MKQVINLPGGVTLYLVFDGNTCPVDILVTGPDDAVIRAIPPAHEWKQKLDAIKATPDSDKPIPVDIEALKAELSAEGERTVSIEEQALSLCLSVDRLISQLELVKKFAAKRGVHNLKVCVSIPGEFTTPLVQVTAQPVRLSDVPGASFVAIVAHESSRPWTPSSPSGRYTPVRGAGS